MVEVFFDFLSPYSWLALRACHDWQVDSALKMRFRPVPVVYGVILEAEGAMGPGETPRKRLQAMRDVARIAALRDIPLLGPPAHPFRSLDALRIVALFEDEPGALVLATCLANAAWEHGLDLTDLTVLADVVRSVGLDASDLGAKIGEARVKDRLRASTADAIARGVCGVPTFGYGGELFHGQDRMDHVKLAVRGQLPQTDTLARAMAARPAGVRRRSAP